MSAWADLTSEQRQTVVVGDLVHPSVEVAVERLEVEQLGHGG
jgi:hypothetical protein